MAFPQVASHTPFLLSRLIVIPLSAAVLLVGCGRGGPKSITVHGTVAHRGTPVEDANVVFMSSKNRPISGKTDAQGRFRMDTFVSGDDGSEEQTVCVTKNVPNPKSQQDAAYPPMISVLPERYASPVHSPLKAAVTIDGSNEFHFDLND